MGSSEFSKQFKLIQQDRRGVVQSSVYPGIKELVSEIYPEEAHFIYELLQNAEDAKATEVYFEIQKTQLIFKHNGTKMFDADDVDSITNIAKSTKRENYVQAGKFGIGFKSVYAFTDTPSIYCDTVCFRIDQLLLPVQIEDLKNRESGWTEFRFPFDSPKITANDARKKIRQGLVEIESTTLLFLNNINQLNYKLDDGSLYSVKKEVNGRFVTCTMSKSNNVFKQKNTWLRFSKDSSLNGKNVQMDVAFPMVYKEDSYSFTRGGDKVCIKFLAKNEKSNLRFYINAPFGCTPARDTVNKEDKSNQSLIREIAGLMSTTITELRDTGYLTDDFFEILPLEEDEVPAFYQPIVEAIKNSFSDRRNLPTMVEGQYVTTENGIMSSRNVIDKIFTQKDIRTLYQNENLCFVKNRPVNSRAYKFLKSLKIKELSPDSALVQMTNVSNKDLVDWLKLRSNEKLVDLYSFLSKGIDILEHQAEKYEEYEDYASDKIDRKYATLEERRFGNLYLRLNKQIQDIKKIAIVKTAGGDFTVASNVYLVEAEIDVPSEFILAHKDIYKNNEAKRFLKSMGAKSFTQEELRGYRYKNEIEAMKVYLSRLQRVEIQRATEPIELARKILEFLRSHETNDIDWRNYRIVYARQSERHPATWQRTPDCCLDKPLIEETGLGAAYSIHNKRIVDGIYNNLQEDEKKSWIEFLKKNGVLWEIRVQRLVRSTGYVTGSDTDYIISNLKQYLELQNVPLARYIWRSLCSERGWHFTYATKRYQKNRNYSTRCEDSTALFLLKYTKWVPDRSGKFQLPRNVSRETIDSSFVIDESNGFLEAIDFGVNAKKREEEEKARREKEFLEQEKQVEAAKRLGFDSTEAVLASKEDSKKIAKLKELGLDIDEIISAEENRKREKQRKDIATMLSERKDEKFKEARSSEYEPAAVVQNPERSKKKVEEELREEPEERKKKISIRKETKPNNEEKQFLNNQYSGRCQVCSKRIIKKDGSFYFEAINFMDTSVLEEKYLTGFSLGWNSLCMCPNCAAEYQYGAVSLYDFKDKVLNLTIDKSVDDYIEFPIKMQGEERTLRYSPVHLFNLQTALNHFSRVSTGDTDIDEKDVILEKNVVPTKNVILAKNQQKSSATLIKKIDEGDRCPDCGIHNTLPMTLTVIDQNGNAQRITGLLCRCGTRYLTRRLYKKIPNPEIFNIVSVDSTNINTEPNSKKIEPVTTSARKVSKIGGVKVALAQKKAKGIERCHRCGKVGTVLGSGLCWNCYKDDRESLYD